MKPDHPLSWIGTTLKSRDEGLYHLVSSFEFCGVTLVRPACGARPFALAGSFPDFGRVPGQKCQRCEMLARCAVRDSCLKRGTVKAPCHPSELLLWHQVGGMRLKSDIGHGVMAFETRCPKCGQLHKVLA